MAERMNLYAVLDMVLEKIQNQPEKNLTQHSFFQIITDDSIRIAIFNRLEKDGFILEVNRNSPLSAFVISIEGRIFLHNGGYLGEHRRQLWLERWTITKSVATVAYSLAVLAVAIWAVAIEMRN